MTVNRILLPIVAVAIISALMPLQLSASEDAAAATSLPLPASEDAAAATSLEFITVKENHIGSVITLGGSVIPRKMVNLSAQMPGDVVFLGGQEGDFFNKGTVLVQLDTAALLAKRRQAASQLASARAGHQNALVQFRREVVAPNAQANSMMGGMPSMLTTFTDPMRSVSGKGSPGYERHSNLVGQDTQVITARNAIDQAMAAIAELDVNIENAYSRAPFDGVIVSKMAEVGDIVQPGMPLVVFADITRMQIQLEVPSRLINNLKEGNIVTARLESGETIEVSVDRIFPMAQQDGGHTTTVKFGMPNDTAVKSGSYAEVLLADTSANAPKLPVIPATAVVWRGSLPAAYLLTAENSLKMKILRTGKTTAEGHITVISGLKSGDKIVKAPTASTRSGPLTN